MMKIDEVAAFVAVMRSQSISQAAETLQLTQPAITRRVQNFEEALGVTLLDRNTKPLKPTAIGLRVFEQCRAILREVDSLQELVAAEGAPSGLLRVGVPQTLGETVLPGVLQRLKEAFPSAQTQVTTGWGSALLERIEHGELDAGCALFPAGKTFADGVRGQPLGQMRLLVVAQRGLLPRKSVRLADCNAQGWVLNPDGCGFRAGLQRAVASQGLTFRLNLETFGTDLQLGLVADGVGLGLVPEPLLASSRHHAQLEVVNVTDFKPQIELWLVQPRFIGNLQGAVDLFGQAVVEGFQSGAPDY